MAHEIRKKLPLDWIFFTLIALLFQELLLGAFIGGGGIWLFLFVSIIPLLALAILHFLENRWKKIFADAYFFLTALLFASEFLYYRNFRTLYSYHMIGRARQLAPFFSEGLALFIRNFPVILLFFLPAILYLRGMRKRLPELQEKRRGLRLLAAALLLFSLLHLSLEGAPDRPSRAREYYFYQSSQLDAAKTFGLVTALGIDGAHRLFGPRVPVVKEDLFLLEEIAQVPEKTLIRQNAQTTERGPEPIAIKPQVLDIDFFALAKTRDADILARMDEYFGRVEPTLTNAYTGIFEGYNLIFITAESFWWPVVDPQRTPTLYRMMTQGIHMKNFYNPLWTVSTSDGEYAGLSGMLPKDGMWSLLHASTDVSSQLLGRRMKEAGYHNFAYHNHTYNYYQRDESHPNMGYDYKGLGTGVDVEVQWPESDLEMMQVSVEEFLDKEPFHVYYLTVSGHSDYSFSGNAMANKNREAVADLPLSEEAASYLAANMELEHALSYLLEKLEEKGIAQRTLIVLNPDHFPYAMSEEALSELAGEAQDPTERLRSTGIIYAPGMTPVSLEKPVSSLDLLPTVYNLLGLPFESRLLMGRDIFSEESFVRFYDRSWITQKGIYNGWTGVFTPWEEDIPEDYVENMNQRLRADFYFSGLVLDEDYYRHLPEEAFVIRRRP